MLHNHKCAIILFIILSLISAQAIADDVKPAKTDVEKTVLPETVIKAFETDNPDLSVDEFEKGEVDGKVVYEIETVEGEIQKDFVYAEDGTLIQTEEEISVDELPEEVAKAVKAAHPDGEIVEGELITRVTGKFYGIEVAVGDEVFEMTLGADGKILASDSEATDDEEDEGDGDDK
jgi:hypothetical protein